MNALFASSRLGKGIGSWKSFCGETEKWLESHEMGVANESVWVL